MRVGCLTRGSIFIAASTMRRCSRTIVAGHAGAAVFGTLTALERRLNERAHARALDAKRLGIREGHEAGDPARAHQLEQLGVPGHRPAVDPEGRREQRHALHLARVASGEVQTEDGAHAEAADDDRVALLADLVESGAGRQVPVLPAAGVLGAVAGELGGVNRVAGAGEAHGHEAHLGGGPAQAVQQQDADLATGDAEALVLRGVRLGGFGVHGGSSLVPGANLRCRAVVDAVPRGTSRQVGEEFSRHFSKRLK